TDEQMAWLDQIIQTGDAFTGVLSNLLADGATMEQITGNAARMRAALIDALPEDIPQKTIDQLMVMAGLTDEQVRFSVEMAGFDETVFRIQTLTSLLDDSLDPDTKREIAIAIATGDYEKAQAIINGDLMRWAAGTEMPVDP